MGIINKIFKNIFNRTDGNNETTKGGYEPINKEVKIYQKNQYRSFYTKVVGVTIDNRQAIIKNLKIGEKLNLVREKYNKFDSNAIAVYSNEKQIGYLPKERAKAISPYMDKGKRYSCYIENITGGGEYNIGVNIKIVEM